MTATTAQPPFDAPMSRQARPFTERARFDEFFATWFPRVYRFAAVRLRDRAAAEAATRATLEAAIRAGLVGATGGLAWRLLVLAKQEISRARRAHDFVTRTPQSAL